MPYNYQTEKPTILTDEGSAKFLKIRAVIQGLLNVAGAFNADKANNAAVRALGVLDNWFFMACIDRMVELKEIRELTEPETPGQFRIFTSYIEL